MDQGILIVAPNAFVRESILEEIKKLRCDHKSLNESGEAVDALKHKRYSLMVYQVEEQLNEKFMDICLYEHPDMKIILLISEPFHLYIQSLLRYTQVRNIIALRPSLSKKEMLASALLLIQGNLFGLKKYFHSNEGGLKIKIKKSSEKDQLIDESLKYLRALPLADNIKSSIASTIGELFLNVIYNAPVTPEGRPLYRHLSRETEVELTNEQAGLLTIRHDTDNIGISVQDPFGSFRYDTVLAYLKKCFDKNVQEIALAKEDEGGRSGLGLFHVYSIATYFIVNVDPGVNTEVVIIIDVSLKDRLKNKYPKSFHYFEKINDVSPLSLMDLMHQFRPSDIQEQRNVEKDYIELVVKNEAMVDWHRQFIKNFGPPLKPPGCDTEEMHEALTKGHGGVREEQTLYCKQIGRTTWQAMVWPWKNGQMSTVKLISSMAS